MSEPEPDRAYRARILEVASEEDRLKISVASGAVLDALGRRYDRFRYGVPLDGRRDHKAECDALLARGDADLLMEWVGDRMAESVARLHRPPEVGDKGVMLQVGNRIIVVIPEKQRGTRE